MNIGAAEGLVGTRPVSSASPVFVYASMAELLPSVKAAETSWFGRGESESPLFHPQRLNWTKHRRRSSKGSEKITGLVNQVTWFRNRLTETGLSLGTPYYMSPEQATGDQAVGASTDTYALGSVLYEMLTGDPPYMGSTAQAVLGQIISGKPVSATEHRPSVPANVDSAVRKALEKLPADRFASAQEFVRALGDEHFRFGAAAGTEPGAAVSSWNRLSLATSTFAAALALVLGWVLLRPRSLGWS